MRLAAPLALLVLVGAQPAAAQMGAVPLIDSAGAEREPAPQAQTHATRILVLGDALGGGLGAGLSRVAEAQGDYEVSLRFNEESGLARPEVYDWAATVPKILESNAYDVIVVMLGANDRQVIRSGGDRLAFNSEGWITAYQAQLDQLLDTLQASGARIVWAGPPPMKDPEYDAAVAAISALQKARVEARGFAFIDMREKLSKPGGGYSEMAEDTSGATIRVRGRDGISFFKAGNNLMGEMVLAALEQGGKPAPAAAPSAAKAEEAARKASAVPLFGQVLMNGEAYVVQPEGVTANAVMLAGAGLDPAAALNALREIAPKDSGAQKLFLRGEAPVAPRGRADDFSAPE